MNSLILFALFSGFFKGQKLNLGGGVHMEGLDFLVTSIGFSVLGYVLCYLTLSSNKELKTADDTQKSHWQENMQA